MKQQILILSIVFLASAAISCATFGGTSRQVTPSVPDSFVYPESPHTIEQAGVTEAKVLAGRVVDAAQFPIPQVLVEQLSPDGKRVEAVLTDSKGRFVMNSRVDAVYALRASKPGFDSLIIKIKLSRSAEKELSLTLTVSH